MRNPHLWELVDEAQEVILDGSQLCTVYTGTDWVSKDYR